MKVKWLIVGAGFSGCVMAERIASQLDESVLIIEKRNHIGGNSYDHYDEHGVLVHRYGPHIFHTNSQVVWDYLSQFTDWHLYYHRVLGMIHGKQVPIPFNLNSIEALFPAHLAEKLERALVEQFGFGSKVPILKLREKAGGELTFLADFIYENVFKGYTEKQWGFRPEELGSGVTGRVPVSVSRDDRYFQDVYQAMPKHGYTAMFERMLAHKNIKLLLNADFKELEGEVQYDRMIFTGPMDHYFGYAFGRLPYRSLRFHHEHHQIETFQSVGTINYPNEHAFTRISEYKTMTGQRCYGTSVTTEFPEAFVEGQNDPYYPIPKAENHDMYRRYLEEAKQLGDSVIFLGRLADYKYYNMDQAVARALVIFEQRIANRKMAANPQVSTELEMRI